jgi:hypothetical protein
MIATPISGIAAPSGRCGEASSLMVLLPWCLLCLAMVSIWLAYVIVGANGTVAVASGLAYLALGWLLWHTSRLHFLFVLPFYFGYVGAVASNVYLEQGSYISEQEAYSYATGSTLRLTCYAAALIIPMFCACRALTNNESLVAHYRRGWVTQGLGSAAVFVFFILVLWLAVLWTGLLVFGTPVFEGITRFEYWKQHPYPFLWNFLIQLSQIAFLAGALFGVTNSRRLRVACLIALLLIEVTNVFYGDKFSSTFLALLNFAIPAYGFRRLFHETKMRTARLVFVGTVLAVGFYCLIYWSYAYVHAIASDEIADYILARAFALQGHTWWGIDELSLRGLQRLRLSELLRGPSIQDPGGLYLLMYAIAPAERVSNYLESGITFSMGGTAMAIYTLGYAGGFVFEVAAGVFAGLALAYLIRKTSKLQLVRAWIALKIVWIALLAFNMGNVYLLWGASVALYVVLVMLDVCALRGRSIAIWLRGSSFGMRSIPATGRT